METHVGNAVRRPEGLDKVTGRAVFVADLDLAGVWWGGTVRSQVPCGRLEGFDVASGFDLGEVVRVGPEDIPGENVVALVADDQPVLCAGEIRHVGEPLLLLAAPDRGALAEALAAIAPRVDERSALFDPERSVEVQKEILISKGDAAGVLAGAERVFEGTYRTDAQEQMYIEPQGVVAWPPDAEGTVVVRGSLQCPFFVRKAVARMLGVAPEKARVIQTATGGAFGGKEDYPSVIACHAALLARAAGRPVALIHERHEDLCFTPKRHPSRVSHRTAVDADGRLLAMEVDILLDGGAYTTLSPVVLSRACIHAAGPYACEHVRIRGRVVATNQVPYGAFRGFGVPQVCFAVERQMDRIARGLGLHPASPRRRNLLRLGDRTATDQRLTSSVGSEEVLEKVLARSGFESRDWCAPGTGRVRRGVGLSAFFHGSGFTGSGEAWLKARVAVTLDAEGRAVVHSGSCEFGQGTLSLFTAIVADTLGAAAEDVVIAEADTGAVPDSGPTVASRTCMIVGGCLQKACAELLARLDGGGSAGDFRARARAFLAGGGDGAVEVVYSYPSDLSWDEKAYRGDAYPAYGWGADVAEVEVDLATFEVRVTRLFSAVDVGKAIQPRLVEGQVQGGSLQAIGFAHLEVVSTAAGRVLNDRMATCIIPTAEDAPPIEVELVEVPFPGGPFGAKGVGELPMDGGAPAVVSAIEDALGLHLAHLPVTPERLAEAWLEAHPEERL